MRSWKGNTNIISSVFKAYSNPIYQYTQYAQYAQYAICTVVVSELISRRDELNEAEKTTNKRLKSYCRQNGWKLIQHQNITEKGLNRCGLHLNFQRNLKLFKNFQTCLEWNYALPTNVVTNRRTKSNTEEPRILNQGDKEPASLLPSQRCFKLASLNINKLTTHIDELWIFLAHNEIDILSINETKLNETISDR